MLVDLVDPVPGTGEEPDDDAADPRRRDVPEALDLRGLVLRARAQLQDEVRRDVGDPDAVGAGEAATVLARLAEAEVPGADPAGWYGVHPVSSTAPTWDDDAPVPVSPSKVESVSTCALRWALETAGGRSADALSQSLGSLIHSIAEEAPTAPFHELAATLDRRWPELGLAPGWPERVTRTRARAMVERLARHFQKSGEVLAVEARFTTQVGRAVLSGSVDRLVRQEDGTVLIEDLKTGTAPARTRRRATRSSAHTRWPSPRAPSTRCPGSRTGRRARARSSCTSRTARTRRCAPSPRSRTPTTRGGPTTSSRAPPRRWRPRASRHASTRCADSARSAAAARSRPSDAPSGRRPHDAVHP